MLMAIKTERDLQGKKKQKKKGDRQIEEVEVKLFT
jgi:hypothetical protein